MRELIKTNPEKCEGCNRCVRVCPIEEANIAYMDKDKVRVRVDPEKCIACGACLKVCQHLARTYIDDTGRFFQDLESGSNLVLIVAPSFRTNFENWESILAWLKTMGVSAVFDVSLGADICTWAHIKYIEKNNPRSLITQPCPVIVDYIEKYHPEIIKYLSPVHSPMLCTAIFARDQLKIGGKIAALSPCVAKAREFDETNFIDYNITFKNLEDYINMRHVKIPDNEFEFDHIDSSLGRIFSMPGGLKENIEYYLGKSIRVDKAEGQSSVYHEIDKFAAEQPENLPAIFDVLNCADGCNIGTGCNNDHSVFKLNKIMDEQRQIALKKYNKSDREEFTRLFSLFDKKLSLDIYLRKYLAKPQHKIQYSEIDVDMAFESLGKTTDEQKNHNCFACGNETCHEMAVKIAKGINISANCIEKTRQNIIREHEAFLEEKNKSCENINHITSEIKDIKMLFDTVLSEMRNIEDAIGQYDTMAKLVNDIALQTNILSINASIEAARSGAAGKGFAVIAQSIRDLANRSRESVNEVEDTNKYSKTSIDMIKNSGEDVDHSIKKVSNLLAEISCSMGII